LIPIIRMICSLVVAIGSAYLFLQTQGAKRWIALAVGVSGISSCLLPTSNAKKDLPIPIEKSSSRISSQIEKNYRFIWNIANSNGSTEYSGSGRAFDFGDRIIFVQTDVNTAGTYIMDLKATGQSVSGVWWYIGGSLPQGTYRGQFSAHGITGIWQSPDGTQSGDWNFTIMEDVPAENS